MPCRTHHTTHPGRCASTRISVHPYRFIVLIEITGLLNCIEAPILLIQNGQVHYANAAAAALIGLPAPDLTGQPISKLFVPQDAGPLDWAHIAGMGASLVGWLQQANGRHIRVRWQLRSAPEWQPGGIVCTIEPSNMPDSAMPDLDRINIGIFQTTIDGVY